MEVVDEATTGQEAVSCAAELQPDLVLMDIKMPGTDGFEATRRILDACGVHKSDSHLFSAATAIP